LSPKILRPKPLVWVAWPLCRSCTWQEDNKCVVWIANLAYPWIRGICLFGISTYPWYGCWASNPLLYKKKRCGERGVYCDILL